MITWNCHTLDELHQLAKAFLHCFQPNTYIALSGDLGAGKTEFVRSCLRAMGVTGPVRSPTFTIIEEYELPTIRVIHADFYRLASPCELELLGVRDYFGQDTCFLAEWPEKGQGFLPPADIKLQFSCVQDKRIITCQGTSNHGMSLLSAI